MANSLETTRQDVEQEAPDKFLDGQDHHLDCAGLAIVFPLEAHLIVFDIEQAMVGDRDAMSIPAHVVEHLLRSGERALGIDDPLGSFRWSKMLGKGGAIAQRFQGAEELQSASIECLLRGLQEEAPEQAGQNLEGQEEIRTAGDPSLPVQGESTAGYHAV